MNNNEPNKIVSSLYKRYKELRKVDDADKYDYKSEAVLKEELCRITNVVGAIEVMSKNNILKLCTMMSTLRFMQFHSFFIQMSKANEYINDKKG